MEWLLDFLTQGGFSPLEVILFMGLIFLWRVNSNLQREVRHLYERKIETDKEVAAAIKLLGAPER